MLGAGAIKKRQRKEKKANFGGAGDDGSIPYPYRLNFYSSPPTQEISLEEFEQWAIDRLRILGEIENCLFRNKSPPELEMHLKPLLAKYLPLNANSSVPESYQSDPKAFRPLTLERRKDHYSHFILRLAFSRSEELRRRFTRTEAILFRHRWNTEDTRERHHFMNSLDLALEVVGEEEKRGLAEQLRAMVSEKAKVGFDSESFLKVDWERVADLVEQRRVFLKGGKAYVPSSLMLSVVMAEFTSRLDKALEATARALPRLDEDDRLIPILNHLSKGFTAPEYTQASDSETALPGAAITAGQIDGLAQHFPLCMKNLHHNLRRDKHLKHFGRLQYGLFLKGIGLSVDEAIIFWRGGFSKFTDDQFNKEYRYNIRHSYGLEGARRSYRPFSCQQILTEHPPGVGDNHGCPYRHFSVDNLTLAISALMGVEDRGVMAGVRQDVEAKKYHLACNRVFEFMHEKELKREKDSGASSVALRETIIHPNDYFVKSWTLKNPAAAAAANGGVKQEDGDGDVTMSSA